MARCRRRLLRGTARISACRRRARAGDDRPGCRPPPAASAAAVMSGAWESVDEAMAMASTDGSPMTAYGSTAHRSQPITWASARAEPSSMSPTTASWATGDSNARVRAWRLPIRPAPIRPTETRSVTGLSLSCVVPVAMPRSAPEQPAQYAGESNHTSPAARHSALTRRRCRGWPPPHGLRGL